jgi:hypothetical protein
MVPNYDALSDDEIFDDDDAYYDSDDDDDPLWEDDGEDVLDSGPMPSLTWAIRADGTVGGFVDDIEAVKQAAYLILGTERYRHAIYSWGYGSEIEGLIGMPADYCIPELERLISDALMRDDRIEDVGGFDFSVDRSAVTVSFTLHTVFGETEMERVFDV